MISGIRVSVDVGPARAALERLQAIGADPRPLMDIAGSLLEASTRQRFADGRGPGGIPWPPSKRQTYAARPGGKPVKGEVSRSAMGPNRGGRTLVDRGGLLASVTFEARSDQVEVGIIAKTPSAKFAYVHQFGATIRPKKGPFLVFTGPDGHKVFARKVTIPARPFIGIDETDRRDLMEAWEDYIGSVV